MHHALLRAAWLQLTLRHSSSSSVLRSKRADFLVELAGRRRRNCERKAHAEGTTGLRGVIAMAAHASGLLPPRSHAVWAPRRTSRSRSTIKLDTLRPVARRIPVQGEIHAYRPMRAFILSRMECLVRACDGPRGIERGRTDFRAWTGYTPCVINVCTT